MEINWKKEVEIRKTELLEDLFTLLRIDSVRDDSKITPDAPVGPGPKEALEAFLAIGERDGFITKNVGNLAGHIEFGEGEELMGVFGHVDVVPTGTGWDTDPFVPVIIDDRIYARGSSDDKGPTMAAYYALKIIRDLKLPISKRSASSSVRMKRAVGNAWTTILKTSGYLISAFLRMQVPDHQW